MRSEDGARLAAALGMLLARPTRMRLFGDLLAAGDVNLDEATYPVLNGLARTGPTTARKLSTEIGIDRSVVSRHSDRLEALGLLRRSADPDDARATRLTLTDEGHAAIERLRGRLAGAFQRRLDAWPAEDARAFVAGMERFVEENLAERGR
ncbi:transcriptional regulator, MarR family [Frankia torreyi]|uniref:Transcriptional regulator, MarR family n=1 Tax=Frankia torreyi TaxID=1856 RepID=A0A0D8BB30_9ACTN|nr:MULTISPECIES: MarR family transcriptional regulator [Frankia]KJE21164.1 transcriptional regulator, MarR family [Frankia torreyi]KQC39533.1 MarR family transcriptional regulator [Frankia sp. ACN1ag]KQM06459.1 transcriptional regulator, MarR family [Frankia sp. CpI1-P]